MTTKGWIILGIVIIVIILIVFAIKVSIDRKEEEQKQLLYQSQLSSLNNQILPKPSFVDQVLSVFTKLLVL